MNEILLSVIIPIYNSEQYLNRCLESTISSSSTKIEFVLINDGSEDGSEIICNKFCKKDSRFKYYIKHNGGLSDARNFGLKKCKGNYITFLDSDDFVDDKFYDTIISFISKTKTDLICTSRNFYKSKVFTTNYQINQTTNKKNSFLRENILRGKIMDFSVCNKIFCKNIIKDIKFEKNKICEDMGFFISYIDRVKNCTLISKIAYNYRVTENSLSRKPFFWGRLDLYFYTEKIFKLNKDLVDHNILHIFLLKNHIYLLFNILRSNKSSFIKKSICLLIFKRIFQRINIHKFLLLDYKRKIQLFLSMCLFLLKHNK